MTIARLSAVIVTHDHRDAVRSGLPALVAELREDDELIVVDNASGDGTPDAVRNTAPEARLISSGENLGFAAGCNRGAEEATGELLLFLNPDAIVQPGFRDAIEAPLADRRGWDAWQGLVTAEGGRVLNTAGGVVHFTGIAWAGGAGRPFVAGSSPVAENPGFVSGACLAIPRPTFERHEGFAEPFFLYHEDVDLSLRIRLGGGRLGVEPAARADHDYDFEKGLAKWRYLERNRWATLVRTYPGPLLAVLMPGLLATELALLGVATAGGWIGQKLAAWADTLAALPRLLRERRSLQRGRTVSTAEFAAALTADLDSEFLGPLARRAAVRRVLRAYWSLARRLMGG